MCIFFSLSLLYRAIRSCRYQGVFHMNMPRASKHDPQKKEKDDFYHSLKRSLQLIKHPERSDNYVWWFIEKSGGWSCECNCKSLFISHYV